MKKIVSVVIAIIMSVALGQTAFAGVIENVKSEDIDLVEDLFTEYEACFVRGETIRPGLTLVSDHICYSARDDIYVFTVEVYDRETNESFVEEGKYTSAELKALYYVLAAKH